MLATGLRRSQTAPRDEGVATVVGFVLVLAGVITYYGWVAHNDVPRWGAEAEEEWDRALGDALLRLDRGASAGIGSASSVGVVVPAAPEPRAFSLPLLGTAKPVAPVGAVSFAPSCGGVTATHVIGSDTIPDLVDGAKGCLVVRAQPTYSPDFGYRSEFGGMLRIQGERASVLTGPPLELAKDSVTGGYRVSATFIALTGNARSLGADRAGVAVDLVPGPALTEVAHAANAAEVSWILETPYPDAWKTWFNDQLAQSGFDRGRNHACTAADAGCSWLGPSQVRVWLGGPSADASTLDIAASITYGSYAVSLR